jgi:hypothetical protein
VSRKKIASHVEHGVQIPAREIAAKTNFQSVSASEHIHSRAMKLKNLRAKKLKPLPAHSHRILKRKKTMMDTGDIQALAQATYTQGLD